MNNDYENKNQEKNKDTEQEKKGGEPRKVRGDDRQGKRQLRMGTGVVLCLLAFVVLYAVVNLSAINSVISAAITVLTPVIIGFAIAYILNPVLSFIEGKIFKGIESKKLKRALSLFSTYLLAFIIIAITVLFTVPRVVEDVLVRLIPSFDSYIDDTVASINGLITEYFNTHYVPNLNKNQLITAIARFFTESGDLVQAVGEYAIKYGAGLVVGIKNLVFAVFISIYVLASKEHLKAFADKAATAFLRSKTKKTVYKYVRLSNHSFGDFLVRKILGSLIVSVITLVFLAIIDAPFYATVSTIIGITNIVPLFGPIVGAALSFFIIFIVDPTKALIFLVFIFAVKQIDAHLIRPRLFDTTGDISALAEIIAILIMGDLFGVPGMVLAVPVFSVIIAVVNEITEDKLRKKNMPVNTAEYYPENSLEDSYGEVEESLGDMLSEGAGGIFTELFDTATGKKSKRLKKKPSDEAADKDADKKTETTAEGAQSSEQQTENKQKKNKKHKNKSKGSEK